MKVKVASAKSQNIPGKRLSNTPDFSLHSAFFTIFQVQPLPQASVLVLGAGILQKEVIGFWLTLGKYNKEGKG
jgi:hypothetical protein